MTTLTEALAELKLTERINRIEPSATMAVVAEADKLRQQGIDVVDFGAGEPHFATPQHIKDAAINAIQSNFSKYTAVGGTTELRDAIVHRHAVDFDSDYRREETSASVGGKHALFNAIQVLVDHGDEVILPVPYWVSFKDIVRYAGGNCALLETDEKKGFCVNAEMIERPITPRTRLILLNSTSNPTSIVQKAAVAALKGPQQCVEEMRQEYIRLRDHIVKGLRSIPGIKCTLPEGAFYAYPNVSAFFGRGGVKSASDLAGKLLRESHVATVPGEGFGTRDHIRVSYATTIAELDRGLERMRKFLTML